VHLAPASALLADVRVRRVLRGAALAALVVLGVGGIPGSRTVSRDGAPRSLPDALAALGERDGVLDVTVRSTPEGAPVEGAHLRALAIDDDRAIPAGEADTDARGRAHFDRLPRGEAWILADAKGRARGSTRLAIESGVRAVAIELAAEHTLEVVARDEGGAPVAGAEVEVVAPGDPLPVGGRAGADGRALVGRLGAGPWRATARAPGFEEATAHGKDGETLVLILRKLGGIEAHVAGEDGSPAAEARVAVAGATLWPARVAIADAHGDVRIGSLPAGTYALRATKGDAVSPIEFDVSIGGGDDRRVVLRLARGRFVSARVTDGDAADAPPVPAARVTLAEGGVSPFPLEATTDRAGRARLGPIAAGGAALGARAEGFVARGAVAVGDPPPAEMRVSLVRAGVLTGRVIDSRGRAIDGATIAIVGTDAAGQPIFDDPRRAGFQAAHFEAMLGGPAPLLPAGELGVVAGPVPPVPNAVGAAALARTAPPGRSPAPGADPWVTRADGTFRASPASPGRIRAIVRHPQYVEVQSELLTLTPGGEARIDVVMREGGALEGRVLDAHDRPVARARVEVLEARGDLERTTRTAADGSFAFAALPEAVILTATAPDDDQPGARLAIAVPEGGRKEVTVALPEPREALPVTVVDERGWPVASAQITASSLAPDTWLRTTAFSDAHGDATLTKARGLALRVEVRAPSHAPRVVTADGSEDALRIELAAAERVTGEVLAERGREAIVGAVVTLYTELGARRARTGAAGAFALAELAPGSARLGVRAPGFAPSTRVVMVPDSGGRRSLVIPPIELAAEGSVEGDVVDDHGDPVAGARVAKDDVPTWLLVGSTPESIAVTDAAGRFALRGLPEGTLTLEAYAPGLGRARTYGVKVASGRTTDGVHVVLAPSRDEPSGPDVTASGSVAITLGETAAPAAVVVVSVVEGSEAERAGIAPGDVLLEVDGARVAQMPQAREKLSGPIAQDVVLALQRGDRSLTLRVPREAVRR
jgi:Carboxypeptidase regulatory-like domain/PDZ domain